MNESTVILTGVQINTPIYLGMKREYDFVHPIVDEFCRAAEFVPTPGEAPLHLVAGKGPFQRTVEGLQYTQDNYSTCYLFRFHNCCHRAQFVGPTSRDYLDSVHLNHYRLRIIIHELDLKACSTPRIIT